jgi:hypothetical protein
LSDWPEAMGFWFRSSEDEKKRKACRYLVQRLPLSALIHVSQAIDEVNSTGPIH